MLRVSTIWLQWRKDHQIFLLGKMCSIKKFKISVMLCLDLFSPLPCIQSCTENFGRFFKKHSRWSSLLVMLQSKNIHACYNENLSNFSEHLLLRSLWAAVIVPLWKGISIMIHKQPTRGVLKICIKFTGEHPCRSVVSTKLLCESHFGIGVLL